MLIKQWSLQKQQKQQVAQEKFQAQDALAVLLHLVEEDMEEEQVRLKNIFIF